MRKDTLRLALPSKGELEKGAQDFLKASGLGVHRPNSRQYVAKIPSAPQIEVLFQRVTDILRKVDEGSADLGVTGYDVVMEEGGGRGHDDIVIILDRLGFGGCRLVLAVPESWVDVSSIEDLADLTALYKQQGREFRIATKFHNLTRQWLYEKGISHFSIVSAHGAMEAAPSMGYADMIADITSSGTTLRENRLKQIMGGTILYSEACLIGNRRLLLESQDKLDTVRLMLELMEARLRAKPFISITANICSDTPTAIAQHLNEAGELGGLRGPTIAQVYPKTLHEAWYAVTIVVQQSKLLQAVDNLRQIGGTDITVMSPTYLFDSKSWNYETLLEKLHS
ncbi:MAG: ATP phosphoribosyltransferase [Okeania sp. SIO3B3]|nr:ATP phosphoribosyltransferase [Okeania sp. SIO3B3]